MKIQVANVKSFQTEIARLNKKAARVGVPLITASMLEKATVEQRRVVTLVDSDGERTEKETVVPVDVTVFDIQLPTLEEYRWTLQATITSLEGGGTFVDRHDKNFDVKPWESVDPCRCQHCDVQRKRNLTFVVQNKDDGRTLQVGRVCFADYVGQKGLLALEFQALVFRLFKIGEDEVFPNEGGGAADVVEVRLAIALAELMAKQGGWKNNRYDEVGGLMEAGTHRIASQALRRWTVCEELKTLNDMTHPVYKEADAIIGQLQDLEIAADDDFGHSLQYCLQYVVVPAKKAGLVAYAGEYLRKLVARKELEAKKATMTYVGTVGKREIFRDLTCTKVHSFETVYGWQHVHIFSDPAGNVLVWKTGQEVADVGEKISFKATVKEHAEYRGAKQTIVTRAAVLPVPAPAAVAA